MTALRPTASRPSRALAVLVTVVAVVAVVAGLTGPAEASNDPYFGRQWALTQIGAPQAWARSTGSGITIGIVDTGVDTGHPELAGKVLATADCVGRPCASGGGQDVHGHGTIVSGIAAASTNNGVGIAGVAPDARLVVAKVLDSNGEGRAGDINNGIRWAVDQGARVINLSLGDPNVSVSNALGSPLRSGIDYAWSRGAVPVLASGNYGAGAGEFGSGNYANLNALVVGATTRAGSVASYSGGVGTAKWGLVAPGGNGTGSADNNVLSTFPLASGGSGYASAAGTSMAAPHVAGAVALLLAQGLTPTGAVAHLLATLDRSAPCGSGCQGRLDVAAAVGATASPVIAPASTATGLVEPTPGSAATAARTTVPGTSSAARGPVSTVSPTAATVPPPGPPTSPGSMTPGSPSEMADPLLPGPVAAPILFGGGPVHRSPAVLCIAVVLALGMASAVGSVGWRQRHA